MADEILYSRVTKEQVETPKVKTNELQIDDAAITSISDQKTGNAEDFVNRTGMEAAVNSLYVNNISELRATPPIPFPRAHLLGFNELGDSSGMFYWEAASTEADDGTNIIKVGTIDVGRWKLSMPIVPNITIPDPPTGAEMREALIAEDNTNIYEDADKEKLDALMEINEAQDIRDAFEGLDDTNVFTDADKEKLTTVETDIEIPTSMTEEFTAVGYIGTGNKVVLRDDGNVSVMPYLSSSSYGYLQDPMDFSTESSAIYEIATTYDTTNNRVIVFYTMDLDASGVRKLYSNVGVVGAGNITFGARQLIDTNNCDIYITQDTTTKCLYVQEWDKVVLCYKTNTINNIVLVCSTTDTNLISIESDGLTYAPVCICWHPIRERVVVCTQTFGVYSFGYSVVSGIQIGVSNVLTYAPFGSSSRISLTYNTIDSTMIIATIRPDMADVRVSVFAIDSEGVLNVTGAFYSLTAGVGVSSVSVTFDSVSGKVLVVVNSSPTTEAQLITCTTTGYTISASSVINLPEYDTNNYHICFFNTLNERHVLLYTSSTMGTTNLISINTTGSTTTLSDPYILTSSIWSNLNAIADNTGNVLLTYSYLESLGYGGESRVYNNTTMVFSTGSVTEPVEFSSSALLKVVITKDTINNKIIVAYIDANTQFLYCVVGDIVGSTITFGDPVAILLAVVGDVDIAYDSVNQKVVVVYSNSVLGYTGKAVVGTIDGYNVTFSNPIDISYGENITRVSLTFHEAEGKFLVCYTRSANNGCARVGSISGSTISFGQFVNFSSQVSAYVNSVYNSVDQNVIIVYRNLSDPVRCNANIATISGDTVSLGGEVLISITNGISLYIAHIPESNSVVVTYRDADNANRGTVVAGTVSGNAIAFGTPIVLEQSEIYKAPVVYDTKNDRVVICYKNSVSSVGNANFYTIEGDSLEFTGNIEYSLDAPSHSDSFYDLTSDKIVTSYHNAVDNTSECVLIDSEVDYDVLWTFDKSVQSLDDATSTQLIDIVGTRYFLWINSVSGTRVVYLVSIDADHSMTILDSIATVQGFVEVRIDPTNNDVYIFYSSYETGYSENRISLLVYTIENEVFELKTIPGYSPGSPFPIQSSYRTDGTTEADLVGVGYDAVRTRFIVLARFVASKKLVVYYVDLSAPDMSVEGPTIHDGLLGNTSALLYEIIGNEVVFVFLDATTYDVYSAVLSLTDDTCSTPVMCLATGGNTFLDTSTLDTDNNHMVLIYRIDVLGDEHHVTWCKIVNGSVVFGNDLIMGGTNTIGAECGLCYDSEHKRTILTYIDLINNKHLLRTIDFENDLMVPTAASYVAEVDSLVGLSYGRSHVIHNEYRDVVITNIIESWGTGKSKLVIGTSEVVYPNTTFTPADFVGIAQSRGNTGDIIEVVCRGGISGHQVSLVPKTKYYLKTDSTLTDEEPVTGDYIEYGTALSDKTIALKGY